MTRRQMEKVLQAEELLIDVYQQLRDTRGCGEEAKRLDTILGKLYNFEHIKKVK